MAFRSSFGVHSVIRPAVLVAVGCCLGLLAKTGVIADDAVQPEFRGRFRVRAASRDSVESNASRPVSGGFHANVRSREEEEARRKLVREPRDEVSLPESPGETANGPAQLMASTPQSGYYPTKREWETIGGYYPRKDGDSAGGGESDRTTSAPAGLWPYPSAGDRRSRFNDAVDRYLGLFAPDGGLSAEAQNLTKGAVTVSSGLPFLTRAFNPERATLKLGPAYVDILALSGTLLYSDYHGPEQFPPGEGPGWLAVTTLDFRVVIPLTQSLFLAAAAEVYYLPLKNRVGFGLGEGGGLGLGLNLFAGYTTQINGWWFSLTDHLGTGSHFADLFGDVSVDEIQRAGRYRFGREDTADSRHIGFFAPGNLYLANTVTASAMGLLNPNWRLTADVARVDGWDLENLDLSDYRGTTRASVRVDYAGQDWRFAPFAEYSVSTDDGFELFLHQADVGIQGPITERLRLYARAGYYWTTGDQTPTEGLIYELGLTHEVGPYTRQSLFAGSVVSETDFADRRVGRYVRYTLDQVLSRRARAALFGQWSDTRDVDTDRSSKGYLAGASLAYQLGEYTRLSLSGAYEEYTDDQGLTYDRQIYTARLERRLRAGLTAALVYQYEDYDPQDAPGGFHESLYYLTLTQLF